MKRIEIDPDRCVYDSAEYEHVVALYETAMDERDAAQARAIKAERDALNGPVWRSFEQIVEDRWSPDTVVLHDVNGDAITVKQIEESMSGDGALVGKFVQAIHRYFVLSLDGAMRRHKDKFTLIEALERIEAEDLIVIVHPTENPELHWTVQGGFSTGVGRTLLDAMDRYDEARVR